MVIGKQTNPQMVREGPEPIGRADPPGGWAQGRANGPSTRAVLENREVFPDQQSGFRPDLDYEEEDWGTPEWSAPDDRDAGYEFDGEPDREPGPASPSPGRAPAPQRESAPPPPDDGLPAIW